MGYSPNKVGFIALQLGGPSLNRLADALMIAYDDPTEFNKLVRELEKQPAAYLSANFKTTVDNVVRAAVAQGWDGNLILAARDLNPGNVALQKVAASHFATPITVVEKAEPPKPIDYAKDADVQVLERSVTALGYVRFEDFLESFTRISRRVCKVEVTVGQTSESGTGFLVGADVVLTNYHVVEDLLAREGKSAGVTCRFDYLGPEKNRRGTTHALSAAAAFPIAWGKPSPVDGIQNGGGQLPDEGDLDYALLRLETKVADEDLTLDGPKRGFIKISAAPSPAEQPAAFAAGAPLVIVQHPEGAPLSLAIDTQSVIGLNGNNTRLRYRTNTEEGSSGSPCCTMDLVPIALHHAGDPKSGLRYKAQYNQGIPLQTIVAHIRKNFAEAAALLG